MQNNTEIAKELLNKAFKLLPDKFAFQEVRSHVYQAINQMSHIENKKITKLNQQKIAEEEKKKNNLINSLDPSLTLELIDEMLKEEQKKLMILQNKKDTNVSIANDIQNLHD